MQLKTTFLMFNYRICEGMDIYLNRVIVIIINNTNNIIIIKLCLLNLCHQQDQQITTAGDAACKPMTLTSSVFSSPTPSLITGQTQRQIQRQSQRQLLILQAAITLTSSPPIGPNLIINIKDKDKCWDKDKDKDSYWYRPATTSTSSPSTSLFWWWIINFYDHFLKHFKKIISLLWISKNNILVSVNLLSHFILDFWLFIRWLVIKVFLNLSFYNWISNFQNHSFT